MPMKSLLDADIGFPSFTGEESAEEKCDKTLNYLYMLLENLRYTLGNLDAENFNDEGLKEIGEIFSEPIIAQITGEDGYITDLYITAEALNVRLSNAENDISQIYSDVNSISLSVDNYGSFSTIKLTGNGITAQSQVIALSGYVTFYDLENSGTTQINGDNIVTGTITGTTFLSECYENGTVIGGFKCQFNGGVAGEIYAHYNTPANGITKYPAIYINASGYKSALKLSSAGGTSITSGENIYMLSGYGYGITLRSRDTLNLQGYGSYESITVGYSTSTGGATGIITLKEYIKGVINGTL